MSDDPLVDEEDNDREHRRNERPAERVAMLTKAIVKRKSDKSHDHERHVLAYQKQNNDRGDEGGIFSS